jgi:hypothetical protein
MKKVQSFIVISDITKNILSMQFDCSNRTSSESGNGRRKNNTKPKRKMTNNDLQNMHIKLKIE